MYRIYYTTLQTLEAFRLITLNSNLASYVQALCGRELYEPVQTSVRYTENTRVKISNDQTVKAKLSADSRPIQKGPFITRKSDARSYIQPAQFSIKMSTHYIMAEKVFSLVLQ